ncbi:TPA: hypothetical protein NPP66_004900 [Klebsiella quasipneumoniae subsp. similipneumoniae]|uniref:hypothetical protein n=1 Tax=Klebsiella pneumoniae TaxID=573 RepID=UPI001C3E91D3|nr:hypothetical protein [Klebsiella pneumoniae]MBV5358655.1 hypothetical protein [Klebsiella pneumoniae]HCI6861585.1 hypothetical protein [Klebsiella quasipneumoniae subsp. similipneumoniae]
MFMYEEDLSPQDVIAYRDDPFFSHKTRTFATLAVDCVPGTLLASDGTAYESGDVLIALDSHKAGANVPVIVVDRGCVLKRNGLRAASPAALAAAITAIENDGLNRVSE